MEGVPQWRGGGRLWCNTGQVGVGVYPDMGVNLCGYGSENQFKFSVSGHIILHSFVFVCKRGNSKQITKSWVIHLICSSIGHLCM